MGVFSLCLSLCRAHISEGSFSHVKAYKNSKVTAIPNLPKVFRQT